jgi:hypothetical protein
VKRQEVAMVPTMLGPEPRQNIFADINDELPELRAEDSETRKIEQYHAGNTVLMG